MNYRLIFSLWVLASLSLQAQNIEGYIFLLETDEYVAGAEVALPHHGLSTQTTADGYFSFPGNTFEPPEAILVSYLGAISDTILWEGEEIYIGLETASIDMDEVVVEDERAGTFRPTDGAAPVEVINKNELSKAACCDLAGCFETQGTVRPQTTNVITRAQNLQMLGLSGVYNQALVNGHPLLQGLNFTYGVSSYPGPWIENIFVAKGANSVLQGFDGMVGQINMETSKPTEIESTFANVYANSFGEVQVNFHNRLFDQPERKWSSWLGVHMTRPAGEIDRDNDNFMDVTQIQRVSIWNQWKYASEDELGWSADISGRYLSSSRTGGQLGFEPVEHALSTEIYGQHTVIDQADFMSKVNYRFSGEHKLSLHTSASIHDQNSQFGVTDYNGNQYLVNSRLTHDWHYSPGLGLKWGLAHTYRRIEEEVRFIDDPLDRTFDGTYLTELNVLGLFFEHEWQSSNNAWRWVVGSRFDHDPALGEFLTARTQLKYEPFLGHVFRLSAGNGWRQVALFAENMPLLSSNREVRFQDDFILPEQAWNSGMNYTYTFGSTNVSGYLAVDYYYTAFQQQFFPDYDREVATAIVSNFDGDTRAHGAQVEGKLDFSQGWELKASYNFAQVERSIEGNEQLLPFIPRHRIMAALTYVPNPKWQFDLNLHAYGSQRLPSTANYPVELQQRSESPNFSVLTFQLARKWDRWEVYGGVENMFDFRQKRPILGWENPFGQYFDPSFIWGPTRGREWFMGVRYRLNSDVKQ